MGCGVGDGFGVGDGSDVGKSGLAIGGPDISKIEAWSRLISI